MLNISKQSISFSTGGLTKKQIPSKRYSKKFYIFIFDVPAIREYRFHPVMNSESQLIVLKKIVLTFQMTAISSFDSQRLLIVR